MKAVSEIAKIRELTKELVVLYVEDEEDIRRHMVDLLRILFREVEVATDGFEGLEMFNERPYDLVITDIQMPHMNGLDMVENIRTNHPDVPIIITTAFSDKDYFIRSIDLKIDKYLLKPIEEARARQVFADIARLIDDRKKAKELEIQRLQEKINRLSERIVAQITESYFSPCIIYTDETVRYFNDPFCAIFDADELQRFLRGESEGSPFDSREGYLRGLDEYDENDPAKNKISVSKRRGRKIYRIVRRDIHIDNEEERSRIYFFNDITLEEYQKIKIRSYAEMLEELVIRNRYRLTSRQPPAEAETAVTEAPAPRTFEPPTPAAEEFERVKITIEEDENRLLRRSHVHKTTAADYAAELDDEILRELQELDELDRDFGESIYLLKEEANIEGLRQMAVQLEIYASKISMLFEFEDLSYAIRSLAKLLASIDEAWADEKKMKKIIVFLGGIQSDLADWRRLIFVEQSALDIHYLDSSLFSACLQIEVILSEEAAEVDSAEEDLVLF